MSRYISHSSRKCKNKYIIWCFDSWNERLTTVYCKANRFLHAQVNFPLTAYGVPLKKRKKLYKINIYRNAQINLEKKTCVIHIHTDMNVCVCACVYELHTPLFTAHKHTHTCIYIFVTLIRFFGLSKIHKLFKDRKYFYFVRISSFLLGRDKNNFFHEEILKI